jgi:uncharacterized protein with von Willebrand factor type A (vWA) domain
MTQPKATEGIRLSDNSPLTLYCSALVDFLWQDFIRESRPIVTYLTEKYNINQLSRFGKEIFERLYNGDDVSWIVSLDAFENYFRDVCDGNTTTLPEGYKPENGLWYAIMEDLSQAAGWVELLGHCVGDQFKSGNNAISILNDISKVIETAIEQQQFDVELLTGAGDELEKLRELYKEAVQNGDTEKANELRKKGKELGQQIAEAISNAKTIIQPQTDNIVDNANKSTKETESDMGALFGTQPGVGSHKPDLKAKKELASKLAKNKELKNLAKKLGALRKIWQERKKARKVRDNYESITGARFDNDIVKAFPSELSLAATEEGKALFALKYSYKTLLTKDYTASRKDIGKGPIVMYVDVSGSMGGEAEMWSKAIAFVIAEEALKENREVQIHLFDTRIDGSVTLEKDRKNNSDLLDFVGTWTLGGGTSFNAVLAHAIDKACKDDRADVLMITDGNSEVNQNFINRLNKLKSDKGIQWNTVCINTSVSEVCRKFSDEVYAVNIYNAPDTVDAIQRCLR